MRRFMTKLPGFNSLFLTKPLLLMVSIACYLTSFAKDPIDGNRPPAPNAFIVSGKVIDGSGNALANATISEKGTSNATSTTTDGSFSITIQGQSAVLVISYVGFELKEVPVNSARTDLSVQLTPLIGSLEDVVVV